MAEKELSRDEFEKKMMKDSLIIAIIGLSIFILLVIWGFKILLEL